MSGAYLDDTPRNEIRCLEILDEGSVSSRGSLAEHTSDYSVDIPSYQSEDQEEDDVYGVNDESDNSSLESNSSSHDSERCNVCDERLEDCRHYRCSLDHCSLDCSCPTCRFCLNLNSFCSCPQCALCDNKPHQCHCVSPRVRRIRIDSSRRVFNIFRFAKPNLEWPDPVPRPQTVVLQGDMVAVITIGHPLPNWRQAAWEVEERVLRQILAAKQRLYNLFIMAPSRAIEKYKERREWQKHVVNCRTITLSEPVAETDYKYVIEEAGLRDTVTQLASLPMDKPYISFDMEAKGLGHETPLCVMQIRDHLHEQSYLVDLLVLGSYVFGIEAEDGKTTLKTILEDPNHKKLIFFGRQDSCTLFANEGIKLRGVIDLQIMYMLTSNGCPAKRTGLKKVVELTCKLSMAEFNT